MPRRRFAGDDAEPAEGHRSVARLRHLLVEHGLVSVARKDLSLNAVALVRDDAEPDVEDDAKEPVWTGSVDGVMDGVRFGKRFLRTSIRLSVSM
jgi:hypothetical protein